MRITGVTVRTYRVPFDPPFRAAWDPVPRDHQAATLVEVTTEDGISGFASGGDGLPDAEALGRLLAGTDATATERVREICETVDLHGGRPWAVEIAVWDAVGKALGRPIWQLLGGASPRKLAYASTGELLGARERAERATELVAGGVRALKLRFHLEDWRRDVEVVERVRDAVGPAVEIMVDANQGWRMPGDVSPRWDVATAAQCARALETLGVYWLEEPLRTDDLDGYRRLGSLTTVRLAGGELVRNAAEARDLVLRARIDVLQSDVLFVGGIGGCRRLAGLADLSGRMWSPHTWSNGYGLVANLHAAAAFSTCPFVEVPFDPPAWSAKRRDWLLPAVVEVAPDGTVAPPEGPGLGVTPDLDALEQYRVT
jgi:L-alanine-DL-glutamate epimerase-like enolase superfamily enzyme